MLRMAVTTAAESFERMNEPLAAREIDARHVEATERIIPLTGADAPWQPDDFDVGYIYPTRLMEGAVLDTYLDIPWVNGREAVVTSRNKAGIIARLDRANLPVPETVMVSNPVDESHLRAAYTHIDGPVVVKPNSTTRGVGVARADDLDTFLGIADYLELVHEFPATGDKAFLVQEYLPDAQDLRIMVIDGSYAGAVERRLSDAARADGLWKHNVHRGADAVGVTPPDGIRELAEEVADVLKIPLLGVDVLVRDGTAIVSETNARPTIDRPEKYEEDFYDRLASLIRKRAGAT